ncbi:calcium-binding protein PBP1-like [Actinidia eriantha]|uniref:calcium-binding protein PBP1-like n=1 Tax=Actinidia eriantha TaxID=165200 RepID=UPI00258E9ACB|nr:calcium-binding protein PBP1-like [Actinidia eriantha]
MNIPIKKAHTNPISLALFAMEARKSVHFQDLLPIMAQKLGGEGLIRELCNGFRVLMDGEKGLITFESLKRNSVLLGLQDFEEDELRNMIGEGDLDGDGALNQMEFCVLMFRLSPQLMGGAERFLDGGFLQDHGKQQ